MRWEKLGRIFLPSNFELNYAKSPQAVVMDDFVRIYFSCCRSDGDKVITVPKYADYTKDFSRILYVSQHDIIEQGDLGCFDEHGIFPFSPLLYKDKFYAYTSGLSRRVSVSIDSGIGLCISNDNGNTFTRLGKGPILTATLNQPFLVIDGFVRFYENLFHMWHIYGIKWVTPKGGSVPERVYQLAHATSIDGIQWNQDDRLILEAKTEYECQALPTVIFNNNRYHMFFCYREVFDFRENKNNGYRIGYAYSDDLEHWVRNDESAGIDVSKTGWDSEMICYPNVFKMDNQFYLLYNGNTFGKEGFGIARLEGDLL